MRAWLEHLRAGLSRPSSEDRSGASHGFRNLCPFVARHGREAMVGTALIACTALLSLPQPLIDRYLIDVVILGDQLGMLAPAILALVGVKALAKLTDTVERFVFARLEQGLLLDIQRSLFDRVLRFPKSVFDDQETGYLTSRLSSDVQGLRWLFSSTIVYMLSNGLRLIGGVGLVFYLEWRLALVTLAALPGLALSTWFFSRKLRVLGLQGMEQYANVASRVQESLSASSLIKAFTAEGRTTERIAAELRSALRITLEQTTVSSVANLAIQFLPKVARVVVLALGAYWVIHERWSLGSLLAFQASMSYVYGPARFLASANLQLQNAMAALGRVSALFDIVPEENTGTGLAVTRLGGEIEFRDVSFTYDGTDHVLEGVSCHIQSGERIAIVGPSGVGKTTLVSLLLRFYKPTTGEIWFDGKPASTYELASLRRRFGYVSQRALLLAGTIEENLRYGHPEASGEQVVAAARAAGIHDFVVSLPEGYGSPVGEGGVNLSEGQKQRLAIARALIRDPDILLFDEPTSFLDSVTERSILEVLPGLVKGKTLFIVTHRLSTAQEADRTLLLNQKRLVAIGTHQELLASSSYYRSLIAASIPTLHESPE
jgi:subfamily B ATP-binding cassette protein MsbA